MRRRQRPASKTFLKALAEDRERERQREQPKPGRPVCAHCGKPYGQRATTTHQIRWPQDGERPPYIGNGVLIKDGTPYQTASQNTVRAITMLSTDPKIRAAQLADIARVPEKPEWVATREVWDGESYRGGYKPFCTLRCALDYARKAYKAERAVS